ncbi:hypothetical protein HPP92_016509 [Vanilla planifolia]|uniref:Uncharacterized protein n=1 Tax=Vanilla planifolia TaxID=51239 RepID=A0A835UNI6_VANPL|nr:hypothetical protein HPP92_016509 [Vanilla planifolia]
MVKFKKSAELFNGKAFGWANVKCYLYPECKVGEDLSPPRIDQWNSPDLANRHLSRGMKGCIEWSRGLQKHSLKAKLLRQGWRARRLNFVMFSSTKFFHLSF